MEQEGGMSRLIDEAEAIKRIKDYTGVFNENGYYTRNDLIVKAIRETPTAYDVDAVVHELEELRGVVFDEYTKFCFDKAIDVVKRGGRNE